MKEKKKRHLAGRDPLGYEVVKNCTIRSLIDSAVLYPFSRIPLESSVEKNINKKKRDEGKKRKEKQLITL